MLALLQKISTSEPKWLSEYRQRSLQFFNNLPLEQTKYTKLDIDFSKINISAGTELDKSTEHQDFIQNCLRQEGGVTISGSLSEDLKKQGVIFCDLRTAIRSHEDKVWDHFNSRAVLPEEDKLVALNNALFTNGTFLYVPKNVTVEVPIRNIISTKSSDVFSQTIIIADEGSKVSFIEEDASLNGEKSIFSNITEVIIKDNAQVDFASFQNFSPSVTALITRRAVLGRYAKLSWALGTFGSSLLKSKRDTMLKGEGSEVRDIEVFYGNGSQHFDMTTNVWHMVPNTKADLSVKGVLKDGARSISLGMVRIAKEAQKTDSYLAEHTLLLDQKARADAIPALEIEANDVRAAHASSTSQIDENQIFYLQTRGLDDDTARKTIVAGFLNPVIEKIPIEDVRTRLKTSIESKWQAK